MTKSEMAFDKKIKEYKEYQLLVKATEREMEKIKEQMIKMLEKAKLEEIETDAGKCSYKLIISEKFDSKAFKSKHAKMYEEFKKKNESMRFLVQ